MCATEALFESETCVNCECNPTFINHRFNQVQEKCDIQNICFVLKLSNAADPSRNVGKLTIPEEKYSLFKIVDSSNKLLNTTMFEDNGEIRMNMKVNDAP